MDLRQLKYFTRIVELESITAAAETLHIAQPSLSQHVANLETELETTLLLRGPGGVRATESGKLLYRHAKMVLRQVDEAKSALRHGRDTPAGHVTIGFPTSTSRVLALPVVEAVAERYPDVLLEIVEGSSADLAVSVSLHRMDIAVAMDVQPQPARMTTTPLLVEDLYLVGQRLKSRTVTLQDMSRLPMILPSFPNSIRVLAARAFADAMLPVNLVTETSAVSVLLSLVGAGKGWTILPASALAGLDLRRSGLAAIPISAPGFTRRVSLCMSLSSEKSVVCSHVHRVVIEVARDLVQRKVWNGVTWRNAPV
ncbi:LysR family transcriptional regulator [Bordetella sp. H567]|uniref:LysR substrate-binding domain-containing protein n=1 Tax=Bordetella sp. H567 TaxID=1697043 RepID=UPI00081CF6E3|nr:LysR substrate-binding domain-containing protein [Bordetella sp. H567]AOB32746.1 LysR family transcriptional regulator [Bordetella sp. H567]